MKHLPTLLLALALGACSDTPSGAMDPDAGSGDPSDAVADGSDALPDALPDAEPDAEPDALPDAEPDAAPDIWVEPAPTPPPDYLGGDRPADYFVPDDYDGETPIPVILALHGFGTSDRASTATSA